MDTQHGLHGRWAALRGWRLGIVAVAVLAVAVVGVSLTAAFLLKPAPAALPASARPAATPRAPTPTPVTPAAMTLDAALTFTPTTTDLGDAVERVNLVITSNAPVSFEAYLTTFTVNGHHFGLCGDLMSSCIVEKGRGESQWTVKGAAPRGIYHLVVWVPSYSYSDLANPFNDIGQEQAYQDWVGKLGVNLAGNPLAVRDPKHPAILNLQRELTVTH